MQRGPWVIYLYRIMLLSTNDMNVWGECRLSRFSGHNHPRDASEWRSSHNMDCTGISGLVIIE